MLKHIGHDAFVATILFIVLRLLASGLGIELLRYWLWLPLNQYSDNVLRTASHSHIMKLSSDFHDSKSVSEISSSLQQARCVTSLMETICFQVLPMLLDLVVAFAYLYYLFDAYMALIVATVMIAYLYLTTKMVAMKTSKFRQYISGSRKEYMTCIRGLDGWLNAAVSVGCLSLVLTLTT